MSKYLILFLTIGLFAATVFGQGEEDEVNEGGEKGEDEMYRNVEDVKVETNENEKEEEMFSDILMESPPNDNPDDMGPEEQPANNPDEK